MLGGGFDFGEFLLTLLIGSGMIVINLGIQVWAVSWVLRVFEGAADEAPRAFSLRHMTWVLSVMMMFLFAGHILQFTTWALLFTVLNDPNIPNFGVAFYHSVVNFTSLGYGDLVMSEEWRLLGALEAANGVLMFGLTAGLVLAVMNNALQDNQLVRKRLRHGRDLNARDE
ncbi:MAG: ion channel [Pseudomonadota bacterium]